MMRNKSSYGILSSTVDQFIGVLGSILAIVAIAFFIVMMVAGVIIVADYFASGNLYVTDYERRRNFVQECSNDDQFTLEQCITLAGSK